MRSPSRAPPPRRRVGSMATQAMRSLSCWSTRRRRTSSSVRLDLPDPPVPVMPSTGVRRADAARSSSARSSSVRWPVSAAVRARAIGRRGRRRAPPRPWSGRTSHRSVSQAADDLVDHAGQPEALAVLGAEDRDPGGAQALDLGRDDDPAAAPDDLDVAGAGLAQQLDEVLEVLDVAALVGGDGDALDVLLDRGVDDLADAAVVAEVDHLGALALHDPPHDVDRRVVAVEQGRGADDADRVHRHVELGLRGGGLRCHEGSLRGRLPRDSRTSNYLPASHRAAAAAAARGVQRATAEAYGSGAAASTTHSTADRTERPRRRPAAARRAAAAPTTRRGAGTRAGPRREAGRRGSRRSQRSVHGSRPASRARRRSGPSSSRPKRWRMIHSGIRSVVSGWAHSASPEVDVGRSARRAAGRRWRGGGRCAAASTAVRSRRGPPAASWIRSSPSSTSAASASVGPPRVVRRAGPGARRPGRSPRRRPRRAPRGRAGTPGRRAPRRRGPRARAAPRRTRPPRRPSRRGGGGGLVVPHRQPEVGGREPPARRCRRRPAGRTGPARCPRRPGRARPRRPATGRSP